MCGIVGYIGKNKANKILLEGLKTLEYRGYDSAGVAILDNNKLNVYKEKGRVINLYQDDNLKNNKGTVGIAHTRWATHGVPSRENAHPHLDMNGNLAVVHNGIIENYLEIKDFLKSRGYTFKSETDTEVIPNLISYYYNENQDLLLAFSKALKMLKGSYAILVLSPLFEGILAAKMASPLVIGVGDNETFLASDIPAILDYTKSFYFLKDGKIATIHNDEINFYNQDLDKVTSDIKNIDWDKNAADKKGYPDYMLKEIFEQPEAVKETLAGRLIENEKVNFLELNIDKEDLDKVKKIYVVACGTAMHAGLVLKYAMEAINKITTEVVVASEFRYNDPIIYEDTLCIFVSQSGETADTIAALNKAHEKGAKTIAITNVVDSTIARIADARVYTHAGPEIAVASTKAYVSQVALLILLAVYFAEIKKDYNKEEIKNLKNDLRDLPAKLETVLDSQEYEMLAKELYQERSIFYIGRGNDYNIAMEGSLKLKEISYIHSEAYPAGELKHGPIALIEEGTPVIGIITNEKTCEKTISNLEEVRTRGAKIIIITNIDINVPNASIIKIPKVDKIIAPVVAIVPLQLLAYYIAKEKGLDVDKPRNLAKSVTVE